MSHNKFPTHKYLQRMLVLPIRTNIRLQINIRFFLTSGIPCFSSNLLLVLTFLYTHYYTRLFSLFCWCLINWSRASTPKFLIWVSHRKILVSNLQLWFCLEICMYFFFLSLFCLSILWSPAGESVKWNMSLREDKRVHLPFQSNKIGRMAL